jgi:hypothetical protein
MSRLVIAGDLGCKAFGLSMLPMVFPHVMAGEHIVDEFHYINALSLMAVRCKYKLAVTIASRNGCVSH